MMKKDVRYFGYGANRSPEMMESLTGRKVAGFPARLVDYELCIQTWEEIPEKVRSILITPPSYWGQDFRAYCVRPAPESAVLGQVWYLTRLEREIIYEWEINGLWLKPVVVPVKSLDGKIFDAETEIISGLQIKQVVDGENYNPFLNDKSRTLEAAAKVRERHLRNK